MGILRVKNGGIGNLSDEAEGSRIAYMILSPQEWRPGFPADLGMDTIETDGE